MYVYVYVSFGLYQAGFYRPDGAWVPESDHRTAAAAARRVHYLNGGTADVVQPVYGGW